MNFFVTTSNEPLQLNYRKRGHPDKVDQSQSRRETKDSNFFFSANEMSSREQWNLNLFARSEKSRLSSVNFTIKF